MSPILYKSLHENKEDVKHNPFKSDMFSLGYCFIYAASLNLDIIFKIRDINNTFSLRKILMKEFNRRYSEKFVNLILKMICFDEEKRIDFIDLEKILKEQF
jgi:serine/threonine protein kinase